MLRIDAHHEPARFINNAVLDACEFLLAGPLRANHPFLRFAFTTQAFQAPSFVESMRQPGGDKPSSPRFGLESSTAKPGRPCSRLAPIPLALALRSPPVKDRLLKSFREGASRLAGAEGCGFAHRLALDFVQVASWNLECLIKKSDDEL